MYRKPIYALLNHIGGIAQRATTQPFNVSLGGLKVDFKGDVTAKNPKNIEDAITAAAEVAKRYFPYGIPVPDKPNVVMTPFGPPGRYVDVEGFPPGTEVKDPYTGKIFLVP